MMNLGYFCTHDMFRGVENNKQLPKILITQGSYNQYYMTNMIGKLLRQKSKHNIDKW